MGKYIVTYKLGKSRRVAMSNGRICKFRSKKTAKKKAKEYEGLNPRIAKLRWG